MTPALADASYYQAWLGEREENHSAVLAMEPPESIITTEWLLAELLNGFSRGRRRRWAVLALVDDPRSSPDVPAIPAGADTFAMGLDVYAQRLGKNWSLVVCISFQLMWDQGITRGLAFDDHFWQAGFIPVR